MFFNDLYIQSVELNFYVLYFCFLALFIIVNSVSSHIWNLCQFLVSVVNPENKSKNKTQIQGTLWKWSHSYGPWGWKTPRKQCVPDTAQLRHI